MELYITEQTKSEIEEIVAMYKCATISDFIRDIIENFIDDTGKIGMITDFPTGETTTIQINMNSKIKQRIKDLKKETGKKTIHLVESAYLHYLEKRKNEQN